MKRLIWLDDSLERIREFPADAKRQGGFQLQRVQAGMEPPDWKQMASIGLGVKELRVRAGGAFRIVYVAKFPEAVYVLHAFQKKSNKTAAADVETARRRFRALVRERKQ